MPLTAQEQLRQLAAALLAVQRELSALLVRAADPVAEAGDAERRAALARQRDDLLQRWGRGTLSWLLAGGTLALVGPDEVVAAADAMAPPEPEQARSRAAATPAASPAPARLADGAVHALAARVGGPPERLETVADVGAELRHLHQATAPEALAPWDDAPREAQQALVGLLVARARHVQDEVSSRLHPREVDGVLDAILSALSRFSRAHQPGFVFGLRRHHHPVAETWADDAARWWERLGQDAAA